MGIYVKRAVLLINCLSCELRLRYEQEKISLEVKKIGEDNAGYIIVHFPHGLCFGNRIGRAKFQ